MRQCFSKIVAAGCLVFAAALLFAACTSNDDAGARRSSSTTTGASNSTSATQTATVAPPVDDVRRVTIPELQKMMADKEAVLIDVREENAYRSGHINGSLSIPRPELLARLNELPKDKLIVFYCA